MEFIFEEEGFATIGAALEVYNTMGPGFLEEVYQECLEIELQTREIPFLSQVTLELFYKKTKLEKFYRPDLIVFDKLVVELKATPEISNRDEAQLLNYLKATGKEIGYLFAFGHTKELKWKRMVF